MPEQTFGGDDEGGGIEQPRKKIPLSKFGLSPDINIRDVFWKIMASYAATKKPGMELSALENSFSVLAVMSVGLLGLAGLGQGKFLPCDHCLPDTAEIDLCHSMFLLLFECDGRFSSAPNLLF
jgi:hypothetical protein